MSASETIVLGVVSGVLTAALLFLLGRVLTRIALPWYRQLVYSGLRIEGEWFSLSTQDPTELAQDIKLELEQRADQISGTATFIRQKKDVTAFELVRTFNVAGVIEDGFVRLTLTQTDKTRMGAVMMMLKVLGDGRTLSGVSAIYSVLTYQITHASHVFKRDPHDDHYMMMVPMVSEEYYSTSTMEPSTYSDDEEEREELNEAPGAEETATASDGQPPEVDEDKKNA